MANYLNIETQTLTIEQIQTLIREGYSEKEIVSLDSRETYRIEYNKRDYVREKRREYHQKRNEKLSKMKSLLK